MRVRRAKIRRIWGKKHKALTRIHSLLKIGTRFAQLYMSHIWVRVFINQLNAKGNIMNRRGNLKLITASIALGFGLAAGVTGSAMAQSKDTIKVGILHSLSGTMAISETLYPMSSCTINTAF